VNGGKGSLDQNGLVGSEKLLQHRFPCKADGAALDFTLEKFVVHQGLADVSNADMGIFHLPDLIRLKWFHGDPLFLRRVLHYITLAQAGIRGEEILSRGFGIISLGSEWAERRKEAKITDLEIDGMQNSSDLLTVLFPDSRGRDPVSSPFRLTVVIRDWRTGRRKVILTPSCNNHGLKKIMRSHCIIRWIMLPRSVRERNWYPMVLLLGALMNPPTSRAQAGFVDPSFLNGMTGPNSWLWAATLQPDGKLLLGGQFTSFNGVPRGPVARLNVDGTVDTTFSASVTTGEPTIHGIVVQSDGKVLIGGMFTGINGAARVRLARLNGDGTLDTNFVATVTSSGSFTTVNHLALQTNSQVVIAGWFETVNGARHTNIARLNSNGSLDLGFVAGIDTPPNALALQADGRVLIGGAFSTVNGQARGHIACLNTDGTLDTNFLANVDGNVDSFARQPDGKMLIAGNFNVVNGQSRHHIARLHPDGSLDATFQNGMTGANDYVGCIGYDPSGKVLIGGQFATVNGIGRTNVARLNSNGSLDTNFLANVDSFVELLLVQPDSRAIIEGNYINTVDGRSRNRIARLQSSSAPLIGPSSISAGVFSFDVAAIAGRTYGVEASTNLLNWSMVLSTNAAVDNFTFQDTGVRQFPRRFFRVFKSP